MPRSATTQTRDTEKRLRNRSATGIRLNDGSRLANRTTLDTSGTVHRWQKHIPSDSRMFHSAAWCGDWRRLMGLSPYYLCREDAARHVREKWGLPCSPKWLAKLAVVGGGPIYRKAGRTPLYAAGDLDVW